MTTFNAALESPVVDTAIEATVELGGDLLVKKGLSRNGLIVAGAVAGAAVLAGVGYWGFKKYQARRSPSKKMADANLESVVNRGLDLANQK